MFIHLHLYLRGPKIKLGKLVRDFMEEARRTMIAHQRLQLSRLYILLSTAAIGGTV